MACSASAPKLAATCGRPTITIRESIPAISTPTVVTVRTVHLYWIRLASVGEWRAPIPGRTGLARRETAGISLGCSSLLVTSGGPGLPPPSHLESDGRGPSGSPTLRG